MKKHWWIPMTTAALALAGCGSGGDGSGDEQGGEPGNDAGDQVAPMGFAEESLMVTGLYDDPVAQTVADGVFEVQPEYPLWSDGATKRRWLALPEGAAIDTSDMDNWSFPVGTKAWKEFTRDGVRVETRLLEKTDAGWDMTAYAWNEAQDDAVATPDGASDVLGTEHDIPDTEACHKCHDGMSDTLIGISALQLDHALGGTTLADLDADGLLTDAPAGIYDPPGDDAAKAALGYLHANCGTCHNERNDKNPMRLWLAVDELDAVESTGTYRTTVGVAGDSLKGHPATELVVPGDPEMSLVYARMQRRGDGGMPFVGSEIVDDAGSAAVAAWIRSL